MNEQKQIGQLHAVVIQNLPELTPAQRQAGIKNPMRVQRFLLGLVEALRDVFKLAAVTERDMTGWKCVEPVPVEEGEFEPVLQEFLQEGETILGGEEMIKRAKKQGANTGLRHAEAMLKDQDKIPEEYRKFVLVFPEVWLDPDGSRDVWSLYWRGKRWVLDDRWLVSDFDSHFRLVSSRKYQK